MNQARLDEPIRIELGQLRRCPPGITSVARLREVAPTIWHSAVGRYPTTSPVSDRSLREFLREATRICAPVMRRDAASALFGLTNDTYGKTAARRREIAAAIFGVTSNTFRQNPDYEAAVLDELTARLVNLISLPSLPTGRATRSGLIERPKYLSVLTAVSRSNPARILVWGEPGVGKTRLVEHALELCDLSPVARLRLSNDHQLHQDLLQSLHTEGLDCATWTLEYCLVRFREILPGHGATRALVIDDIEAVEQLERVFDLWPASPLPTFILSRKRLALPDTPELTVGEFTMSEALTVCRRVGITERAGELAPLCLALGNRPLAIDQAMRFLKRSRNFSVSKLTHAMFEGAATTVDSVARAVQARRNLATLYGAMLTDILIDRRRQLCLDGILWLSNEGRIAESNLRMFMLSAVETDTAELEYESVLTQFCDDGLVTVDTPDSPYPGRTVVMHSLTREILCELRQGAAEGILATFVNLLRPPLREHDSKSAIPRHEQLRHWLREEFRIAETIATRPRYRAWGMLLCLDEFTWLHLGPGESIESRPLRLMEVTPTTIYEIHRGTRREVDEYTANMMVDFTKEYRSEVARMYHEFLDSANSP